MVQTSNDAIFEKEFREMMYGRRARVGDFKLSSLPLPPMESSIGGHLSGKTAIIKGVKEPYFERLNKQEVTVLFRKSIPKRQVLPDGEFRRDDKGKYVCKEVAIKKTSVLIVSTVSIGLTRFKEENGMRVANKVTEGFQYVDFYTEKGKRKYMYIIPKEYVYMLTMCSLVVTPNKRRVYYSGAKVALQNGSYAYIYVVPYKYTDSVDARIITVKADFSFKKEITELLEFWKVKKVLFDLRITELDDQVKGVKNLGFEVLAGTLGPEDFEHGTKSLAESKEEDLQTFQM